MIFVEVWKSTPELATCLLKCHMEILPRIGEEIEIDQNQPIYRVTSVVFHLTSKYVELRVE